MLTRAAASKATVFEGVESVHIITTMCKLVTYILLLCTLSECSAYTLQMMGTKRGRGNLKNNLRTSSPTQKSNSVKSLNKGKGQEIFGVSLPKQRELKGWEFGDSKKLVCTNVGGKYYAIQANCPRCAFDLYNGKLVIEEAFGADPQVACPTCSTTFSFVTGEHGPPYKQTGLAAFVGNAARTATISDSAKNARAYVITRGEDGKVYCRDR